MKICHTFYEKKKFGGSETYFRILRKQSAHKHHIAYVDKSFQYKESFENFYEGFSRLVDSLRQKGFDVIHNHFFIPAFFSEERGLPNMLTSHCMLSEEFLWSVNDAANPAEARAMKLSSRLFGQAETNMYPRIRNIQVFSDFHRREIEAIGGKATKVPIILDASYFGKKPKEQARASASIPNKFTILFSGRPTYYKGLHILLEGFGSMKGEDIQLVILSEDISVDDGMIVHKPCISTERNPKKISTQRFDNSRVIIRRTGSRERLADYYSSADVFICPSLYESVGYVNLEAMASRVPIVASDTCGIPEFVINGKTGLLFEPGNPQDLIEKVLKLRENKPLADKIRENQRQFVSQFDVRKNIKTIDRTYEEIK